MKSVLFTRCAILNALIAFIISTHAATLQEGAPAPKLYVSKWLQGEPVKDFKPGTAYLVEFWATWFSPCRDVIPHVNRLHNKYRDKGLVVIGLNVKQGDVTKVGPYMKHMGELMSYRIALDDHSTETNKYFGKMVNTWLTPAEQGIPSVFLIDKQGKLAWIGDPDELDEKTIEQVLAGTFDAKKRALEREAAPAKAEEWETHSQLGKKAWQSKEWDKAMSEIDQCDKILPQRKHRSQLLRITVLIGKEDFDSAKKIALQLSDEYRDDPFFLGRIARTIANRAAPNSIILDTGDLILQRAIALFKEKDSEFLHTQARLAFMRGKKEDAIRLETEAISLAQPESIDQFKLALESYKAGTTPK